VLRRREGTRFSSPSDDEVGGYLARSALAMFAPPICRRSRRNGLRSELILRHNRFVGSDEDGGSRRTSQRAERAIRQRAQRVEQSSTPDRGDEARPAGQIGMIAYADEATVLDEDLWSGLPLQISVLNAEQAGRS
jgi:hypothetical protein